MSISFGIPPWELKRVATHYIEERRIYLMARFEAQWQLAEKHKCSPSKIVLPEW